VPALEHAGFVGSRGGGVVIEDAKLQKTCTQPNEQSCNAMPNQNIQAPSLSYSKVKSPLQFKGNQINATKLNSLPTVKRIVKKLSSI
jgi:3-dehydroshikimate dehydratase